MPEVRPVIGDFRPTNNDAPRADAPPTPAPAPVATPDPVETTVAAAVNDMKAAAEAEALLTPVERYQKRLKEADISAEDAQTIYDGVLSKGYHEQYVYLGKNKARAVFRTRLYEDSLRIQTALEMQKPTLVISQDDLITRYNMASSLYEWQGKTIPHETEADFNAAMALIRRLPVPVYQMLALELAKFDRKIMLVFSEGAAENFS